MAKSKFLKGWACGRGVVKLETMETAAVMFATTGTGTQRPINTSCRDHVVGVYLLVVTLWCHMATWNLVNVGSGNGLLPDGTKLLLEPALTYPKSVRFRGIHLRALLWEDLKKHMSKPKLKIAFLKISSRFPKGQWVKYELYVYHSLWHNPSLTLCDYLIIQCKY